MILMYHKIYPESPTIWWVTLNAFWDQMESLRRYQVVYLDDYDPANPKHAVITFDGVYENVCTYALPVLKNFGYPFELFVVGETIGKGNEFDQPVEPPARFADFEQLKAMTECGGRIQWHSMTHKDMSQEQGITQWQNEIEIPGPLRQLDPQGFRWFAYPHGKHTPQLIELTKKYFQGAVSCVEGNHHDRYQLNRITVTNDTAFKHSTVSLIIPNYNYGRFAAEAIESALLQTVKPDEILFIDDCSDDNSIDIAERYKDRIKIVRNEKNLGIVSNFNKAVSLTGGDYVCFLGADNRFRSDYVEKCKLALDIHQNAAIAYTYAVIFGPRAEVHAQKVGAKPESKARDIFLWEFRDFNEETKEILKKHNFMHGSSMYRRSAFDQVRGYMEVNEPEDHNLFLRMVEKGWNAVRVPEFLLEYRQHSHEQSNTQLNFSLKLALLHRQIKAKENRIKERDNQIASLEALIKEKDKASLRLESFIKNHTHNFLLDVVDFRKTLASLNPNNVLVCHIDSIDQLGDHIKIEGWALIQGHDTENNKTSILLLSDKNIYSFRAQPMKRPDITAYFKTFNYDNSGFIVLIPTIIIENDEYEILIHIQKNNVETLQHTNRRLSVTHRKEDL